MSGVSLVLIWIGCVIVGALAGLLLGWILWELGLELIGSAVMLVGAGAGGIVAFFAFMNWSENRRP
jgi:uncharacterized membrane protein YebE (DUF533 family)